MPYDPRWCLRTPGGSRRTAGGAAALTRRCLPPASEPARRHSPLSAALPASGPTALARRGGEGGAAILSPLSAGAAMEPCGGGRRLRELRREAAEYYRGQRVPQRVEEALNALFPLCPTDLYGALVPPGGVAVREAPAPAAPEGGRGAAVASGRAEAWPRFPSAPSAPTCP